MKQNMIEKTLLRMLYLEDSPHDVDIVRELLTDSGYDLSMDCTEKKKEFTSLLQNHVYDIILSDFKLPGFDAFGALELSQEHHPDVPFICVSGSIGEEIAIELIKQGAVDYILKDRLVRLPLAIKRALEEAKEKESLRRAEIALRENELKFRTVADYTYDWEYWENENHDIVYISPSCERITGYSPQKFIEDPSLLEKIVHPEDIDLVRRHHERVFSIEHKHDVDEIEYRIIRNDGSVIHISHVCKPIFDTSDQYHGRRISNRDITERKQAEESLRKSEEKYRSIFENIQDVYYEALIDGTLLEVSPSIEILSKGQYHRNELIGKSMFDFYPNKIEREALLSALMEQRSVADFEITLKNRDGSQITSSITSKVQCNAQGRPEKIMGTMRDITERKRVQEKNAEQAHLLDVALDTIIVRDIDDRLLFWNKAAEHLYGWTSEEARSLDVHRLVYDDDQTTYEKNKSAFLQKGFWEGELRQKTKDGRFITTYSRWTLVRDQQGIPAARLIVTRDVTENKKAEESLRNSNAFNELLLHAIPFGMDIVDEQGTILFLNGNMKKLVGDNAVGQCCWSMYKDDKKQCLDCPLRRGIEVGRFEILESTNVFGGRIFQINHIGIIYQGKKAMLEVFVDVTEQRKLQNQFLQSQKIQSIGTLAGGIAHDFNNILGIILIYASILERGITDKEKIVESSGAISKAVERGAALVRQILTFARQADVTFQPLRVPDLVNEITSMLKETFPKVIEINVKYEKGMPFINADHSQMHQALLNLCVNARDAMPNGGILSIDVKTVEQKFVRERFPEASNERFVCIAVSDTGTGIDAKIKNLIFDPFFTTKEKGKGTGLGLSVVYGVMQTHHGFVAMESEVGKGTMFLLYLPIPHDPYTKLKTSETENFEAAGGTEGILIVEDEDILRKVLKELLESKGYKIYTAADGLEAVGIYQEHKDEIDLVLTDMGLPKMSGSEVFKKMCEINARAKVLLASGFLEPDTKTEMLKAGAKGFIQKPYKPYEVLKEIRKILDEPEQ
jgi:PAS domain S-box-containing protein